MLTDCEFFSKQSISEMQACLAHKKKKIQILKQEKNSMLQRIDELNQKVHEQAEEFKKFRLKCRGLEKQHTHLKSQNENLRKDQSVNNETIQLYQKGFKRDEFKRHERIIAQLQDDIVKLSNSLEEHKLVRESNSEELTRQMIYISELEQELQQFRKVEHTDQLKYNNQQLYQTIEELNQQIYKINNEKDQEYQQQIQEIMTKCELNEVNAKESNLKCLQLEKSFQQQLLKLVDLCNSVYEQLKLQFSDKPELFQIIQKLKLSKKDIDFDIAKFEAEIQEQNIEQLQNQVQNLSNENQNIKQKYTVSSTNQNALQMREKDLIHQIEKLQQQVDKQKELNSNRQKTMSDQVFALHRANKQLTLDLDQMTKEIEQLRVEKESLQQTIQRQEKKIQTLSLQKYK